MKDDTAHAAVAVLVAIIAFAGVILFSPRAYPQDGHSHYHEFYRHWLQPGTSTGCCNAKETNNGVTTGDCYPTTARVVNGRWVAKTDDGGEVEVPDDRVLRERNPAGQDAHLCYSGGRVLCFVPADGGS